MDDKINLAKKLSIGFVISISLFIVFTFFLALKIHSEPAHVNTVDFKINVGHTETAKNGVYIYSIQYQNPFFIKYSMFGENSRDSLSVLKKGKTVIVEIKDGDYAMTYKNSVVTVYGLKNAEGEYILNRENASFSATVQDYILIGLWGSCLLLNLAYYIFTLIKVKRL